MGEFSFKEDVKGHHVFLNITGDYMFTTDTEKKVEKIVKALEKQIPKKPKKILRAFEYKFGDCPTCGMSSDIHDKCCNNCGQKLDWECEI